MRGSREEAFSPRSNYCTLTMAPASSFLVALLGCSAGTIAAQAWDSSLFTSSEPIYPSRKFN